MRYTAHAMHEPITVGYKKVHPNAVTPEYKTSGSVAFDFGLIDDVVIAPRSFAKVRTGLVIVVPDGHFLAIVSRSSNPVKKGIDLANSIGVIDTDYCGPEDEIFLVIENITDTDVRLAAGDRIAQGIILPVPRVTLTEVTGELTGKNRGGHGSTG